MKDTILLLESRDLCYESNHYFMVQLEQAFEKAGYKTELWDLSDDTEEKLEELLRQRQNFSAAFDFNSRLAGAELEDGTPYLDAFSVPFFNYLVDHPLYHHGGLRRHLNRYSVVCIDHCHGEYIRNYYPHIKNVYVVPLGAMDAGVERTWEEKKFELLFLGTYVPAEEIYEEICEYPKDRRMEVLKLLQWMEEDVELTQEAALERYLIKTGEELSKQEFAKRLNQDYIVDRYLRFSRRKKILSAIAKAGLPLTAMGEGLGKIEGLLRKNVTLHPGVGFALSARMIANAKILLNITPGFLGGVHDRVYSARMNRALCFTEENNYTRSHFTDGGDILLYNEKKPDDLSGKIEHMLRDRDAFERITKNAYQKAVLGETWEQRAGELLSCYYSRPGSRS